MQMNKLVMIAMLAWGSQAFAELSSGGDSLKSKLVQIRTKARDLNDEFSGLRLRPREDISSLSLAEKTMRDLGDLDVVLRDTSIVPLGMLMNLACAKAYCFGESNSQE